MVVFPNLYCDLAMMLEKDRPVVVTGWVSVKYPRLKSRASDREPQDFSGQGILCSFCLPASYASAFLLEMSYPALGRGHSPLPSMASMVQAYAGRAAAPPLPRSTGASGFRLRAGFTGYVLAVDYVSSVFLIF